jgi:hypothetical protein
MPISSRWEFCIAVFNDVYHADPSLVYRRASCALVHRHRETRLSPFVDITNSCPFRQQFMSYRLEAERQAGAAPLPWTG